MRIAFVGIGGVGGYYGGRVAQRFPPGSEHEVFFVCRGAHRDAIEEKGLRVITPEGEFVGRPSRAVADPAELGRLDLVFGCVKGYDLAAASAALRPVVDSRTVLVPLGNGVDNHETMKAALGVGDFLNGCVYISSHIESPGVVAQTGGNRKLFFGRPDGETDPYRWIEDLLREAGIDATLSDNITRDVWTKFVFIGPVSAVTSQYGGTIGEALSDPARKEKLAGMMWEVAALAARKGVGLPDDIVEQSLAKAGAFPPDTRSSMQLDVESGRKTEIDTMLGYVVREGKSVGVDTPVHRQVYDALAPRVS